MNITKTESQTLKYETQGVCCKTMHVTIKGDVIQNIEFLGGCDGNLKGIKALLNNMHIDEIIAKFRGITCGDKSTSCPDQLALCLMEYKKRKS